ncbi:MAG: shikimate dehydrogenase [Gammaproteobacteria bacterium]|uniref:Shikimate dehydrogenase (NADP(+)) n=1 Tax=OM182 bacterium MED-G24 TaxID=1986255 RepID=A0A2A5WXV6_9GAMM|nr:shikimate dehydrogenase [Gammaproteobacteria bacterium]PDH41128.1 MAG: shikimate dehydrogenase [OM182 bacterium MED-G24]RPG27300.1 MAG: shikimate dehydrogenase [Gammaproteobacteria bacterium TMED50]
MIRLAVLGDPVEHSRSPEIHQSFADQCGVSIDYRKIRPERFEDTVSDLVLSGVRGFNCTVPFKELVVARCDTLSEVAQDTGAVNTVVIDDGKLHGDNTDGEGLLRDLVANLGWLLRDRRILLLGAGGAARGVLPSLLSAQPACVHITNRTLPRATDLVSSQVEQSSVVAALDSDALEDAYDLVINATSAGLSGAVPDLPGRVISSGTHAYDMVYGVGTTAFNAWASEAGARVCADGLGMLVEQAAVAFYLWTGQSPETAVVIGRIRDGLR